MKECRQRFGEVTFGALSEPGVFSDNDVHVAMPQT